MVERVVIDGSSEWERENYGGMESISAVGPDLRCGAGERLMMTLPES
jgi:hypothetical protein